MIDLVAALGGDFIGLNPLHAPFLAMADRCSPYEPSSRLFLNPLYVAVDALPRFSMDADLQETVAALRATDLVDYARVAAVKLTALRSCWMRWRTAGGEDGLSAQDFSSFCMEEGEALRRHALFEALSADLVRRGFSEGWHGWPVEYRDPDNETVAEFAAKYDEEVQFHSWLQWITHRQLEDVKEHAGKAGLRLGLYLDLAVGEAMDGSATWSNRAVYLQEATVGSPPDPFAPDGQDWNLAGFQPSRIAFGDTPPFERMVARAMRYAGAIRIDHAAALRRLFLVPVDRAPREGAYVLYPQEALIAILARMSHRFACIVIGEDLGLLPEGLQDELAKARILSYRILSYERDDKGFKPASAYPRLALSCISTHDHQTLAGWWQARDIAMRAEHGIVSDELTRVHKADRLVERQWLQNALDEDGTRPAVKTVASQDPADLTVRAHSFIAKTPSLLAAVRLADLTDEKRPTNVPGTSDTYPNWCPKLSVPVETLKDVALVTAVCRAMTRERARRLPIHPVDRLKRLVRERPLAALAIAAAIGYLTGSTRA